MALNANWAATVASAVAQVTVANAGRDGSGTLATVLTAGANGSRIDTIRIVAVGTTTAGAVRLFIHDGTTARLYDEIMVPANTVSTTVPVFAATLRELGILLKPGHSLRASTNNAEAFNVFAQLAGDF